MSQKQQSLRHSLLLGSIAGFLIGGTSVILQKDIKPALILGAMAGTTGAVSSSLASGTKTNTPSPNPPDGETSPPPAPPTPPTPNQIAVFWDYENVKISNQGGQAQIQQRLQKVIEYIETQGSPAIKKAYSKWGEENKITKELIDNQGFKLIEVSSAEKNSVDIHLIVACMRAVCNLSHINKFIIFTNDNDYAELANTLRQLNKKVVIIGRENKIGKILKDNADETVTIESLIEIDEIEQPPNSTISYDIAVQYLVQAIKSFQDTQRIAWLSEIDKTIRTQHQDYRGVQSIKLQSNRQFSSFTNFLEETEINGLIKIESRLNNYGNSQKIVTICEVDQPANPIKENDRSNNQTDQTSNSGNSTAKLSYNEGVVLLLQAIQQLNSEQKKATMQLLGSTIKNLAQQNKKVSFQQRNGVKFKNFTQFIKQVEQDGKVKVQRFPNSQKIKEVMLIKAPTLELVPPPVRESA
ncbi:MAG: NYN domain-containing protein [Jaaginema sp. PMC 1079.18]|nr:NYN domain-containing protein [Jaaginema sp. PMC 1080.18]MEC4852618.1 NYN domain-containing protein [Jaaginema sp. PMC 1079.18]MEC4866835.1 NYN domain-containing protein [Jaaginema sp. PMC 1078.18]